MIPAVDLDAILDALGEPSRRGVVALLKEGPRRASDLAEALDLSRSAMSRHLRVLWRSGLVEEQRTLEDARVRMFRLRAEPIEVLSAWVEDLEGAWKQQLDSFQRQAERRGSA